MIAGIVMSLSMTADVQVVVATVGGDIVDGRVSIGEVSLKAAFGDARVHEDQIASIGFGEDASVETADGTVLRGKLGIERVVVETSEGRVQLARDEIANLQVVRRAEMRAGELSHGVAANGVTYCLRTPHTFEPGTAHDAILILHGSNMNSSSYVETIASAWPDLGERYLLIGINGENESPASKPDRKVYNYTYVNYVGKSKYEGYPGTDRESPALVAEVVREIRRFVGIDRMFVGGHSQGGFLTYSLMMNTPELFDGAFPVSGGLIFQCEPTAYEDAVLIAQQQEVPLAIVHAPNDPVVSYSMSLSAFESFEDVGLPMLRLVDGGKAGHLFAHLPIEEAIAWLEQMNEEDPHKLLELAEWSLNEQAYRDARVFLARLRDRTDSASVLEKAEDLEDRLCEAASEQGRQVLALMQGDGDWIGAFLDLRQRFGGHGGADADPCVGEVYALYASRREKQQELADQLFREARAAFRNDRDGALATCERIVSECPASDKYRIAKRWLEG